MKVQPESYNCVSIILENGNEFVIREADGFALEVSSRSQPERQLFDVSLLNVRTFQWDKQFTDRWIRLTMKSLVERKEKE